MQTLVFGLQVSALGIGIVFLALVFLIGVIKIMAMATELSVKKESSAGTADLSLTGKKQLDNPTETEDREIIAVIAAAIACMTRQKVRITTIRRIREEQVPNWAAAGRQETISLRQHI